LHRGEVALGGDGDRALHARDLVGRLDQALLVEHGCRVHDRARTADAAAREPSHLLERVQHHVVVRPTAAEREVNALHIAEQRRQLLREVTQRERGVSAVLRDGALDTRAWAVPRLALGIARSHEEHVARLGAAAQHEHALRLVEPRQVVKIRVLTPFVLDVVVAQEVRRGEHHERGVPQGVTDALPAPRKIHGHAREVLHARALGTRPVRARPATAATRRRAARDLTKAGPGGTRSS
jgi:hypothetical protein